MKKIYTLLLALMMTGLGFSQTTIYTQDFETFEDEYTSSTTEGSTFIDVFNRIDASAAAGGDIGGNSTFIWAIEDSNVTPATITLLDDIDITGFSDFTFSLDMLAHHFNDWDAGEELLITYSVDGGSFQNLLWVQNAGGSFNQAASLDTDFDGDGNCGSGILPAITTGTSGCAVTTSTFETFSSATIGLSSNTTLDIILTFNGFTASDEGMYLDDILIEGTLAGGGCTAPTTQATAYNTTSLATTSATLNWTSGDGDEVLVVVKEASAVDTDPTDGTSYTGNTVFTSGDQIGTGNYVVQSGSAVSSVSITGLTAASTYHVAVYEYNTTGICYELTELTGSFTTDCSVPSDASALSATVGNTTIDLSWTNGACLDEVLVIAREASAVSATPTGDGSAYTADAAFGSGSDLGTGEFAVFKGTGTSETVTGLSNGTEYFFTVFTRKGTSWSTGISDSATPAALPVAGDIVISEIMYNSSGTDDEWIEIYNGSGSDITLDSDWRLTYGASTFDFTSTVITSGSYLTIALGSNGDGTFNNDNPFTPDVSVIATPAATTNDSNNLVNSTATIAIIYDPSGSNVTIDTVTFDDGSPWPTTPDGTGPSLELVDTASDNSLAASWTASDNDGGTPGSAYPVTYTFTGTWSPSDPNGTATSGDNIIIASGNATIDTNTTVNSATVNAGATLTVDTGITLTTTNGLALESTSTSYSSLILDGTVTGTLTYERHVNINGSGTTGSNDLISAPLTGQQFDDFVTANSNILNNGTLYLFGHFDKTTGDYATYNGTATTTLDAGVGYRAASSDNDTFTFTGTANSATVTNDITNAGPAEAEWNLVGNPYPSYLNVQAFLNHEVSTGVSNLNLFDTGTAAIYGYDGTALNGWTIYNLANTTASTVIAPGQGFFVSADATNAPLHDLEFTPAMRSTGTADDFISGRNAAGTLTFFTLRASTTNDSYETQVYFNDLASLGFNFGFDAELFNNPSFVLYTELVEFVAGNPEQLALQTIGMVDLADTTISLGLSANQGEQVTFTLTENTLPATTEVFLDDTVAMTTTLLSTTDYVFTPSTNLTGTGRFFLRIYDATLSTIENTLDTLSIFALTNEKEIVIKGQLQENTVLSLYDIQGREVLTTQLDNSSQDNRIDVSELSAGVYVVNVQNNEQQKSQKVIIK